MLHSVPIGYQHSGFAGKPYIKVAAHESHL